MDKCAIKILCDSYWSPTGWKKDNERITSPEDFAYAKRAGWMFEPIRLTHAEMVERATAARDALTPDVVADGFLASLSTRCLPLRSALGSYAVLRLFPEHSWSPKEFYCMVCGAYDDSAETVDLNVLSFERVKWGGVRHDQPI